MRILFVKYSCKKGSRDSFLQGLSENKIAQISSEEVGNIRYELSISIENEDDVLLSEIWENDSSFENHKKTPHYQKLAELKFLYVEKTDIKKYAL